MEANVCGIAVGCVCTCLGRYLAVKCDTVGAMAQPWRQKPYAKRLSTPSTHRCTKTFSHHSKQYAASEISYWNHFRRTHLRAASGT